MSLCLTCFFHNNLTSFQLHDWHLLEFLLNFSGKYPHYALVFLLFASPQLNLDLPLILTIAYIRSDTPRWRVLLLPRSPRFLFDRCLYWLDRPIEDRIPRRVKNIRVLFDLINRRDGLEHIVLIQFWAILRLFWGVINSRLPQVVVILVLPAISQVTISVGGRLFWARFGLVVLDF